MTHDSQGHARTKLPANVLDGSPSLRRSTRTACRRCRWSGPSPQRACLCRRTSSENVACRCRRPLRERLLQAGQQAARMLAAAIADAPFQKPSAIRADRQSDTSSSEIGPEYACACPRSVAPALRFSAPAPHPGSPCRQQYPVGDWRRASGSLRPPQADGCAHQAALFTTLCGSAAVDALCAPPHGWSAGARGDLPEWAADWPDESVRQPNSLRRAPAVEGTLLDPVELFRAAREEQTLPIEQPCVDVDRVPVQ